jgi:hypothetical protein
MGEMNGQAIMREEERDFVVGVFVSAIVRDD